MAQRIWLGGDDCWRARDVIVECLAGAYIDASQ